MAKFSRNQIRDVAYQAGFRGESLAIAVAVALAESGGDTQAINSGNSDRSVDRGLWQINSIHRQYAPNALFEPLYNARAAYAISSNGTNWRPWVAYTNGSWRKFYRPDDSGATAPAGGGIDVGEQPRGVEAARRSLVPNGRLISVWGDPRSNGPHEGEDIQADYGSPIYAPEAGTVTTEYNTLGGHSVYLRGSSGLMWYMTHMSGASPLRNGQRVEAGTMVGRVGMSGNAKGTVPHLHYQVGPNGVWGDPRSILAAWTPGYYTALPPSSGSGGGRFMPISNQVSTAVTATLRDLPGFVGIATALDQAEKFAGVDDRLQNPDMWNPGGVVGGIGATIADNFMPFIVRTFFVFLGTLLVAGLLYNFAKAQLAGLIRIG